MPDGGPLESTRLFRNDLNTSDHWLDLELIGRDSNTASIGARVSVTLPGGILVQEVSGGAGLGSQNMARLHFGLGQTPLVESVQIRWPNGHQQEQFDVSVDQVLTIKEPLSSHDVNFDGVVDVMDMLVLLGDWGDCADCLTDFDSDDRVTVLDLVAILSQFGGTADACPDDPTRPTRATVVAACRRANVTRTRIHGSGYTISPSCP